MTQSDPPPPLPPRQPVEYGAGSPFVSPRFDAYAMVVHLMGWTLFTTVILLLAVFIVPRFGEIFMDYRLDLPYPTKVLLRVSRFLTDGGAERFLLLLLLPIPFVHALAAGLLYPRAGRGRRLMYRLLVTLAITGVVLFVVLALFLPYIALINAVSGNKR